jgi:hypothetical protein
MHVGTGCYVRYEILMAASMKVAASWDISPCSPVEIDLTFQRCLLCLSSVMHLYGQRSYCYLAHLTAVVRGSLRYSPVLSER